MVTIKLTPDFKEFLKLFHEEKINYLIVGGYAVGIHGVPRPTKDMDLWIALDASNIQRVIRALERFGFSSGSIRPEMFSDKEKIFRMGMPPNRLELFTNIPGVSFTECFERRQVVQFEEVELSVISLNDLIAAKRATSRPQDIADIAKLQKKHHIPITPPPP